MAHPLESALDVGRLLPPCYEKWGPVLRDSLRFFVERLQPARQMAIFAEQMSMSPAATTEERFVALLRHCPTLHKLGQVVSRDRRLAPELRSHLQELESLPPALPTRGLLAELRRELAGVPIALGGTDAAGEERLVLVLGEQPLAEASVAIVVPFTYRAFASHFSNADLLQLWALAPPSPRAPGSAPAACDQPVTEACPQFRVDTGGRGKSPVTGALPDRCGRTAPCFPQTVTR